MEHNTVKFVTPCLSIAFIIAAAFLPIPVILKAQGYDDTFEMRNKLKFEIQYADYGKYEYPEPILFNYGLGKEYTQNYPYLVNFPEKRALLKFTRMAGGSTAISAKYQYSDLRPNVDQHLGELKVTRSFGKAVVGLIGGQIINDTRGYNAYQPGFGLRWNIGALSILQVDAQYYFRGEDAEPVGGRMGSLNLRAKFRQVLTVSTAAFVEYLFYKADGEDDLRFTSHTGSFWLSQFLATQTALHANFRYYYNSLGINSYAPSIEICQYINWATILRVKYRYYWNESDNVSFGEEGVIIPDNLKSHTASLQLNREINADLLIYAKYRYYKSNLGVQMNTYLMGCIYAF